ncbi:MULTISPECIES: glycosyltransferase family 4 protein [unclassified Sphingomonas]|uniref:glycosyltransferase family 4 protein n=1 Tax=unclassified Sphingomonas TaxID=196159 RepID=UPI000700B1CD|nr:MULTISPECIES: glycosyltransferase family 4 protein [unclassified Sphingomonas]KQM58878.1 hypothetical protein ASE65_11025 [Sphingomonas sp. Leaf16]KQN11133.1 hypothetical protein ASE81_12015 [Sphingomonas sp. Leaf29]KQN18432.1 hypothetical protein ASE83_11940 [Sphingomonas sp. Leaf32]
MRILEVSAFYTPYIIGGAEICAQNLTEWFTEQGHDVAVLSAAPQREHESWGTPMNGYRLYRVGTPHIYPVFQASTAPAWKKPIWHLQDIYDPRNEAMFERVIEDFRPDFVHIHWIQGLGYNGLKVLAKHDIPTAITLHDLAYVCVRTTMFRGNHECVRQCNGCRLSMQAKVGYLEDIPRLGFISPSRANLEKVGSLMPIADYPSFHILNPITYPPPEVEHTSSDKVRLLFVGRLENTKGIGFVLELLEPLAERYDFHLTVLGKGPEEDALRRRFGHHPWVDIVGHVPLQQVADTMAQSDLLLVPSLWMENSPGVVFQALGVGLPVLASDKGGLPELIEPGRNGYIAPAGDADRWRDQFVSLLERPEQLQALREQASASTAEFDYTRLAQKMLDAFAVIRDHRRPAKDQRHG